ncbi:MAG: SRPBCC domain-containing protein [Mycobacteriaceae bacterium]|nr:SRPBCC domain-containing protein [Mycobacteriaceae bacterium]
MTQVDGGQSYSTTFSVEATAQQAFEGITNVRGWWSQAVEGVTDRVGEEFTYRYQDMHRCTVRVTELVPGRKVVWHILDNYFDFTADQSEWKDTRVVFDITERDGGAEVAFTHVGLVPQCECYDICANGWGGYLEGSLRNLINSGVGQPNPKDDGDVAAHRDAATAVGVDR